MEKEKKYVRTKLETSYLEKVKHEAKHRGITLIALVITIIILLILAGITLNLALGEDGIITRATKVAKKYEEAEKNELQQYNEFEKQLATILGGKEDETPEHGPKLVTEIKLNKETTFIEKGKKEKLEATIKPIDAENQELKWESSNEQVATVENGEITALEVGTTEITVTSTDGSEVSDTCTVKVTTLMADIAKPGDYVLYKPQANSFTIKKEKTGFSEDQNFNTGDYKDLWQVLYNDDEHGLQIISTNNVANLRIGNSTIDGARSGYNKCVETLNSFCENYVDPRYAESGRSVGSEREDKVEGTVQLPFEYNGSTDSGCIPATAATQDDYNAMINAKSQSDKGIIITTDWYYYAQRQIYLKTSFQVLCITEADGKPWVGGQTLLLFENSESARGFAPNYGVRPCITLKKGIQAIGDGKINSPFELSPIQ